MGDAPNSHSNELKTLWHDNVRESAPYEQDAEHKYQFHGLDSRGELSRMNEL